MHKKITTVVAATIMILLTTGFAIAQGEFTTNVDFPYFLLGTLIIVGLVLTSLHFKYKEMHLVESVGSFALYVLLVSLFTDPVIAAVKSLVS